MVDPGDFWHVRNPPAWMVLLKPFAASARMATFLLAIRPWENFTGWNRFVDGKVYLHRFRLYRTKRHGNWMKLVETKLVVELNEVTSRGEGLWTDR
jgi:hypothetical protein